MIDPLTFIFTEGVHIKLVNILVKKILIEIYTSLFTIYLRSDLPLPPHPLKLRPYPSIRP